MIVFSTIMIASVLWAMRCNNKTLEQREYLRWTEGVNTSSVSYDRHMCHLLTFRDARKLYV